MPAEACRLDLWLDREHAPGIHVSRYQNPPASPHSMSTVEDAPRVRKASSLRTAIQRYLQTTEEVRKKERKKSPVLLMRFGLRLVIMVIFVSLRSPLAAMVILAGVAPPLLLAITAYWFIDAREREPRRWALGAFTWGIVATSLAGFCNVTARDLLSPYFPGDAAWRIVTVTVAPVVEESLKACAPLAVFLIFPRQFDGILDGVVYATLAGLGFELVENFDYHMRAFFGGGVDALEQLAFLRAVIFGAGHAMITTFTGMAIGYAVSVSGSRRRAGVIAAGLMLAITMHAVHNYLVGLESQEGAGLGMLSAVILAWCGNGFWLFVVSRAVRAEARWVREELEEEVRAGTLRAEDAVAAGGIVARLRRSLAVYPNVNTPVGARALLCRLDETAAQLAVTKHRLRMLPGDADLARQLSVYRRRCRRLTREFGQKTSKVAANAAPQARG